MQKLFDSKKLELYLKEGSRHVDRYLQSGSASVICSTLDIQDELKISGNINEIEVFHGKLLILLCHGLREGETVFAIDVSNTQPDIQGIKTEVDNNKFSPDNLLSSLDANKINSENVKLITSNSQNLFGSDLIKEFGVTNIRLSSIDGDHSRDGVRYDLNFAAATMAEGGVILADDLFNTICPSLTKGIIDLFQEDNEGRLEPIDIVAANGPINSGSNKLIISDSESAIRNKALLQLLDRANYSHSERFRGFSHVLIFDFNEMPTRHLLDGDIRNAVTKFFDRKI